MRDDRGRLLDILEAIERIEKYTSKVPKLSKTMSWFKPG